MVQPRVVLSLAGLMFDLFPLAGNAGDACGCLLVHGFDCVPTCRARVCSVGLFKSRSACVYPRCTVCPGLSCRPISERWCLGKASVLPDGQLGMLWVSFRLGFDCVPVLEHEVVLLGSTCLSPVHLPAPIRLSISRIACVTMPHSVSICVPCICSFLCAV